MKSFNEFLDESLENKNELLRRAIDSLVDAGPKEMLINLESKEQRIKALRLMNEYEIRYNQNGKLEPWEEDAYKKIAPVFRRNKILFK